MIVTVERCATCTAGKTGTVPMHRQLVVADGLKCARCGAWLAGPVWAGALAATARAIGFDCPLVLSDGNRWTWHLASLSARWTVREIARMPGMRLRWLAAYFKDAATCRPDLLSALPRSGLPARAWIEDEGRQLVAEWDEGG